MLFYRLPALEIGDTVRFMKVPVRQPFPLIFNTLGIYHYLAEFHSHRGIYHPISIGFYPVINRPHQLVITTFIPKSGRLISPDPFYVENNEYLTDCKNGSIIEYTLDANQILKINGYFESAVLKRDKHHILTVEKYSMLPSGKNVHNCRTWLFEHFPALHNDAKCHSNYYKFIRAIQKN